MILQKIFQEQNLLRRKKSQNYLKTPLTTKDEMGFGHKPIDIEFIKKSKKINL